MPGRIVQALATVAFACVTAGGGGIGISVGGDDLAHRAALLQAAAGQFQVEVVGQCALAQGREFWIVEHLPPAFVHRLGDGLAGGGVGGFGPFGHLLRFGLLEIRADAAGAETDGEQGTLDKSRASPRPQVNAVNCRSEPARDGVSTINVAHR
ncbi:hypothetical protein D3C76_1260500 [compost metagenome]